MKKTLLFNTLILLILLSPYLMCTKGYVTIKKPCKDESIKKNEGIHIKAILRNIQPEDGFKISKITIDLFYISDDYKKEWEITISPPVDFLMLDTILEIPSDAPIRDDGRFGISWWKDNMCNGFTQVVKIVD